VNYDRQFHIAKRVEFAGRIGYGYSDLGNSIFPLEMGLIIGEKHCFEVGGGVNIWRFGQHDSYYGPTNQIECIQIPLFRVCYRYRHANGFLLRTGPAVIIDQCFGPFLLGGLSLGYSF
jgi:hypothetical protein